MSTVTTRSSRTDPGFEKLLGYLPLWLRGPTSDAADVEEVRFDEGRRATLKTKKGIIVLDRVVSKDDVEFTKFRVGAFNENDRAGIDGALHRISPIRDDNKLIVGLTVRVAQHIPDAAAFLKDILIDPENRYKSVLLVGPPGVGEDDDLARHRGDSLSCRRLCLGRRSGGLLGGDRRGGTSA